jgi:thiol-disulfide isomerase/thioredoxin
VTLEFIGSEENVNFLKYQKYWATLQKEMTTIGKRIQVNRQNTDSLSVLNPLQKSKEQQMRNYLNDVINENKSNFLSVLVKAMLPVEIPEFKIPDLIHNKDSARWVMRYNYNTLHFFDNIDLTDDRLLRTPILQARLEAYFKHDPIQFPDSIKRKIDFVLKKSAPNHKVFQYVSVYLFNYYRESQIMGHDAIMVKLADDIYLSGKADWTTIEFREDLRKQVELLRNNLIGMKAKDLVMDSYKDVFVSLYDVDKRFTILYFWEPNCGHCKEATPKLKAYYDKEKMKADDIEVFSVCTISDKELWKKYIEENKLNWINGWDPQRRTNYDFYYNIQSTPMIYILDRNKRIIAKKLSVDDIPGFIDNYRKFFR